MGISFICENTCSESVRPLDVSTCYHRNFCTIVSLTNAEMFLLCGIIFIGLIVCRVSFTSTTTVAASASEIKIVNKVGEMAQGIGKSR